MKVQVTGFFWYKAEQYDEFKKLSDDGAKLPNTYASWLEQAENGFNILTAQGHRIVKVEADIDEFKTWCARNGYKINSEGRKAFASFKAAVSAGLIKE